MSGSMFDDRLFGDRVQTAETCKGAEVDLLIDMRHHPDDPGPPSRRPTRIRREVATRPPRRRCSPICCSPAPRCATCPTPSRSSTMCSIKAPSRCSTASGAPARALSRRTGAPASPPAALRHARYTEQRRVLYVAAEGAFGLKGRLAAWEAGWHTEIHDGNLEVLPRPVNLTRTVDASNLAALIDWNGYGFVVLDTLSRCMVGADENSARDCGLVVDVLHRLRERTPKAAASSLACTTRAKTARPSEDRRHSKLAPTPCTRPRRTAR